MDKLMKYFQWCDGGDMEAKRRSSARCHGDLSQDLCSSSVELYVMTDSQWNCEQCVNAQTTHSFQQIV